jgi:hypothetical protein
MKVWEETWTHDDMVDAFDPSVVHGHDGFRGDRQRLAIAAPELARLLLEAQWASGGGFGPSADDQEYKDVSCYFCEGRESEHCGRGRKCKSGHAPDCRLVAVLRKAGVLPEER